MSNSFRRSPIRKKELGRTQAILAIKSLPDLTVGGSHGIAILSSQVATGMAAFLSRRQSSLHFIQVEGGNVVSLFVGLGIAKNNPSSRRTEAVELVPLTLGP